MIVVSNYHLHHDKEFYYVSSLEADRIINYFGEVIDKAIEEFDDDYIKLQVTQTHYVRLCVHSTIKHRLIVELSSFHSPSKS